ERQRVASAVLELDEPFRSVVLLRWFEDREPGAIARQLGIPVATVRTRLHRAHAKLRERFEREQGPDWRGRLALLCMPLRSGVRPAVMSGSKLLAAAGLALLVAVGALWLRPDAGAVPRSP